MGLNIFVYLAKGTDSVDNFLTQLAGTISLKLGDNAGDIFREFSKTFVFGADAALGASAAVEASAALVGVGSHMMSAGSGSSSTAPQNQQKHQQQQQQNQSQQSSSSAASASASAPSGNTASSSLKNSSSTSMAFSSQAASSSSPPASTASSSSSSSSSASVSASGNVSGGNADVNPDDAASKLQTSKGSAKVQNWCFAGEDRGARTCVAVNDDQDCISGDIFPRQDLCINPSLRV